MQFLFFLKKKRVFYWIPPLLFQGLFLVPASSCQNLEAFSIACQEKQVCSVLPLIPALGVNGSLCSPLKEKLRCFGSSAIPPFLISLGAIQQIQEFCLSSTFHSFSTYWGQLHFLRTLWVKRDSRLRKQRLFQTPQQAGSGEAAGCCGWLELSEDSGLQFSLKKKDLKSAEQDKVMTEWRETERLVGKKGA